MDYGQNLLTKIQNLEHFQNVLNKICYQDIALRFHAAFYCNFSVQLFYRTFLAMANLSKLVFAHLAYRKVLRKQGVGFTVRFLLIIINRVRYSCEHAFFRNSKSGLFYPLFFFTLLPSHNYTSLIC